MSYAKMAQELRKATKNVEGSDRCMQAFEEHDLQRKAEQDRVIHQMRQYDLQCKAEHDRIIAQMRQDALQHRVDTERLIARFEANNEKCMKDMRRTVYWATAFISVSMVILSISVALFGGG